MRSAMILVAVVVILGLCLLFLFSGCSKPPDYLSADGLRGWKAYRRHCTLCHDADPFQDSTKSPAGPPVAGSSLELLRLRVATGTDYPKGHKPQRDTKEMYALPQAVPEIPYLYAYLKEVRKTN